MSEFNGKKFYGFSLQNDPSLLTNTRNFEFRYMRPDTLERAIQKVQLGDGANAKQKKTTMLGKYCRPKPKTPEERSAATTTAFQGRDVDIETQVSGTRKQDGSKVRDLSATEVEQLIGKVKSQVELAGEPATSTTHPKATSTPTPPPMAMCGDHLVEKVASLTHEEVRVPEPKWVQIEERPRFVPIVVADLKQPRRAPRSTALPVARPTMWLSQSAGLPLSYLEPVNYDLDVDVEAAEYAPRYEVEDSDYEYEMLGRPDYTKYCGQRPREDEMTNVSTEGGYAQFIEIEPIVPCMDLSFLKNASPLRYSELTDECLEDERHDEGSHMKIYIKSATQCGEKAGDKGGDAKGDAKGDSKGDSKAAEKKPAGDKKPSAAASRKKAPGSSRVTKAAELSPRSKYSKFSPDSPCPRPKSPPKTRHPHQQHQQHQQHYGGSSNKGSTRGSPRNAHLSERSKGKLKNIVLTKSLEELKVAKMTMFAKMSSTQERIIETLDKLRLNLLEIVVPDSSYEKHRRQKNAFEFSVRFSRNFLYPLKGMIEDLRSTTAEQLNSSSSNEACGRVAAIYILILQSLHTYHKQLRFFLLDQVPQKLTTLIEMIHTTTAVCLGKGVFDQNDPIVECLQERCNKFLGFLQELHEERFLTARENYCKLNFDKKPSALHGKYDLKMFMNNLNMYEPKLVPKTLRHHLYRYRKSASTGPSSGNASPKKRVRPARVRKPCDNEHEPGRGRQFETSSDMVMAKAVEDAVCTQMQVAARAGSSKSLMASMQNLLQSSKDLLQLDTGEKPRSSDPSSQTSQTLNKAVIEALQMVTKEQVRQVLEPIIQSLGSSLDKENNSETIETILKALNRNLFSMTRAERKTRRGAGGQRGKWSKVAEAKVVAGGSTSSMRNATTASKAAKQTEASAESRPRRADIGDADAEAAGSRKNNNAGKRRSRSRVGDERGERGERDEAAAEDGGVGEGGLREPEGDGERSGSESESESASESDFERGGEGSLRTMVGLQTKLEEEYREEQRQMQQQQEAQRLQRELQLHQLELQQLQQRQRQWQQHHEQQQQPQQQQKPEQEQQDPPQLPRRQSCVATSTASLATTTTTTATTSTMTADTASGPSLEEPALRPPRPPISSHRLPPCHKNKSLLFKRRRTPLLPPPPAPAGTPSTSARSARTTDDVALLASQTPSPATTGAGDDVEESPQAMTKHGSSSNNNNRRPEAGAAERMTSRNQREGERGAEHDAEAEVKTSAGASAAMADEAATAAAASAAIAAAFDANGLGESGGVLNRLCSSMIADVLANCLVNPSEAARLPQGGEVYVEDDEEDDDSEAAGAAAAAGGDGELASYVATRQARAIAAAQETPERGRGEDTDQLFQHCGNNIINRMLQEQQQQQQHEQRQRHQYIEELQYQHQLQEELQYQRQHPEQLQYHRQHRMNQLNQQQQYQPLPLQQEYQQQPHQCHQQHQHPHDHLQQQKQQQQAPDEHQHRRPLNEIGNGQSPPGQGSCGNPLLSPEHGSAQPGAVAAATGSQLDPQLDGMLRERDHFLALCSRNRFYANPNYSEPWKVFSRISEMLATEVVNSVEEDFTIGVSRFVQDFLEMETQI